MKAKFINEIKRGEESGLGSIGVGHDYMLATYNYIKKNFHEIIRYSDELDGIDLLPDEVKEEVAKLFNADESDVMGISNGIIQTYIPDSGEFLRWITSITDTKEKNIITIDDKQYKIYNKVKPPLQLVLVTTYELVTYKTNENTIARKYQYSMNESFQFFRI